ncbi:PIG-L deacetylase family protein [Pseudomonas sp. NA-150]|uniref:PIG-L deacetylase family protein n=1 Tax=Pseudomonas sp. NA-150 TaxID=3367525 RepID=UPI0037C85378
METQAASTKNLIRGPGTPLTEWQASLSLACVPLISHQALVPPGQRLVIVAPHPDDEVLGCAGALAGMCGRENEVLMIAITDGEASHPGSREWSRSRLRHQRPIESARALAELGLDVSTLCWQRMRIADSQVAAAEHRLTEHLQALLRPTDRVMTTWRFDGHCDHEAVGRATARAAAESAALLIEVPIWAWHWAHPQDPRIPWQRARKLLLDDELLERKRRAIAAHVSQVTAQGMASAVLPEETLERLLQPFELVFL